MGATNLSEPQYIMFMMGNTHYFWLRTEKNRGRLSIIQLKELNTGREKYFIPLKFTHKGYIFQTWMHHCTSSIPLTGEHQMVEANGVPQQFQALDPRYPNHSPKLEASLEKILIGFHKSVIWIFYTFWSWFFITSFD